MKSVGEQYPNIRSFFPKIWRAIYKYLADLWRTRCYYVEEAKVRNENRNLDQQIELQLQKDFSQLLRTDRKLFDTQYVPTVKSTPAHNKCWLFSVACAFERQSFTLNPDQKTLFDHGFATFDPV